MSKTKISILATIVPEDRRLEMLPRHLGRYGAYVECLIYDAMRELCSQYDGGYWEFYETSNGTFFMKPTRSDEWEITEAEKWEAVGPVNYFTGKLSSEAAGIVATIYGLSRASARWEEACIIERYQLLLDYAKTHSEWKLIIQATGLGNMARQ